MENIKFNYIDILKQQLELRTSKNNSYSLRAFARDLGLSASRLSEVLSKKKGLSLNAANELADKLGLTSQEREFFLLSVEAQHSRSQKNKAQATQSLGQKLSPEARKLRQEEIELAYTWYHTAILELIELKDCEHSVEWFAKKLNLKKIIVKNAIERMESLGWLVFEGGEFRATFDASETTFDIPSMAIKKYHEEILKKAEHSLMMDSVLEREFLTMTLAFSQNQMSEAKEAIRAFQKDFADKFYPKEKEKDSVYQLSVQLFRLDSNLETKEF